MTIRILHEPGVGDWAMGATVKVEDRRAMRLILIGYAEEVKETEPERLAKRKGKE
jgi:hypothetical protein